MRQGQVGTLTPSPPPPAMLIQVIVLSRGAVAFSGPPSDAEAHFASIGRPFPQPSLAGTTASAAAAAVEAAETTGAAGDEKRGGGGGGAVAWGVNPTDAILDVIGDAETGADRDRAAGGRGVEGGGGLVVMSRELLVRQVGVGRDALSCLPWVDVTK